MRFKRQAYVPAAAALGVLLIAGVAYATYRVREELVNRNSQIASLTTRIGELQGDNTALQDALVVERSKNDDFQAQIDEIKDSVGTLETLAATDPQFLGKYSKVYFLNENYIPSNLALIPEAMRFDPHKEMYFQGKVLRHLKDLMEDAAEDALDLRIQSAYRSFQTQQGLKSAYSVTYGSGANTFSADQGYSEHQLGTTIDFTTVALGGALGGFDKTASFSWLQENAYKYGFILSYPANNKYYVYEPWHWRYVGVELAKRLHDEGIHFNDLDQREINKYLVDFFN